MVDYQYRHYVFADGRGHIAWSGDTHWLYSQDEDGLADDFHCRFIPTRALLRLQPTALLQLIADAHAMGVSIGTAEPGDAEVALEQMQRGDAEFLR